MRYAQDHKAQTHERILHEASARFRRDGIGATGLQPLMKALGLTHGGFYAHFKSKDDLVKKALRCAADEANEHSSKAFTEDNGLAAFIEMYLSETHRNAPEKGCPIPTMSSELGQRGEASPITDELIESRLASLQKSLCGPDADAQSVVMLSTLVGALMLSRSTQDPALSQRILHTTRDWLTQQASES
ncbi:TetR family transcriptional regulator [Pseudomonas sp. S25]|uniref:TetR family transcriptional regulator n=1 Tax=Pseudomonas maioricensis TaxID=1766623 RepID=A0ABS9ZLK0_9PSED|nr:TetR/AcrR family transcriptional regulator [Pseudomonas sp. S25]MCI8210407.1 TetR family transcriptional regulator [Pseudomonas sp. S25]